MRVAFQANKNHELQMDFALGPNQGSGVPAEPDSEGLMLDFVPFNISIPLGSAFSATLPGWGSGRLVSASIALVIESRPANLSATPGFLGPFFYPGTRNILSSQSLRDVSDRIDKDGHLSMFLPSVPSGIEYRLFAFYERPSGYREQVSPENIAQIPQSPVTTFVQNVSWVNDHFSLAGAQLVINFWEDPFLG